MLTSIRKGSVWVELTRTFQDLAVYTGSSNRNPIYWFLVTVGPRGSNKHGIPQFGTSRITKVALYLGDDHVVTLPHDSQVGRRYELRPLEAQILQDIDAQFPTPQLRIVS